MIADRCTTKSDGGRRATARLPLTAAANGDLGRRIMRRRIQRNATRSILICHLKRMHGGTCTDMVHAEAEGRAMGARKVGQYLRTPCSAKRSSIIKSVFASTGHPKRTLARLVTARPPPRTIGIGGEYGRCSEKTRCVPMRAISISASHSSDKSHDKETSHVLHSIGATSS